MVLAITHGIIKFFWQYDPARQQHYSYDAFNQRLRKTEGGVSTYYVTSGMQILAEYSSNDYPDVEYVYAGGKMIAQLKTETDDTVAPVTLRVESAGANDGWDIAIYVNSVECDLNGRGYNLVVIDETSGAVLEQKKYDTYGSTTAADEMADFIATIPSGRIVLVGIQDEGSYRMNENGYLALESLGSDLCRTPQ